MDKTPTGKESPQGTDATETQSYKRPNSNNSSDKVKQLYGRHMKILDTLSALKKQTGETKYDQMRDKYELIIGAARNEGITAIGAVIDKWEQAAKKDRAEMFVEVTMAEGTLLDFLSSCLNYQFNDKTQLRDVMVDNKGNVFIFGTHSPEIKIKEIQRLCEIGIRQLRDARGLVWIAEWGDPKIDATGIIEKK